MRFRRRARLLACLFAVAATLIGLLPAQSAAAATSNLRQTPDATYQTDGRVAALVVVGNTVYLGGNFTSVRPAGASAGSERRPGLAAFNRTTGALLNWNPRPNGSVTALAASPDGSTIYVGGNFTTVGGATRERVAAVSASSGAVTNFRATVNSSVSAVAATSTRVYVGGTFTSVNGQPRSRVAALTATGALDTGWDVRADGQVRSIALSPDRSLVYLGGSFQTINGASSRHLAKISASSGAPQSWSSRPSFPVRAVVVTGTAVFVGGGGSGGQYAAYSTTGSRRWQGQTNGDVQALGFLDGVLYVGGHFTNKILAVDAGTGALDPWNPVANSNLGVFALAPSTGKMHVGGDFTRIGNTAQQGYAQFSVA